jgi:hypothetical protein
MRRGGGAEQAAIAALDAQDRRSDLRKTRRIGLGQCGELALMARQFIPAASQRRFIGSPVVGQAADDAAELREQLLRDCPFGDGESVILPVDHAARADQVQLQPGLAGIAQDWGRQEEARALLGHLEGAGLKRCPVLR